MRKQAGPLEEDFPKGSKQLRGRKYTAKQRRLGKGFQASFPWVKTGVIQTASTTLIERNYTKVSGADFNQQNGKVKIPQLWKASRCRDDT
jgi:hypothetical protein